MKRGWLIVLLLSLGLNVGLGVNLLRRDQVPPPLAGERGPADLEAGPDHAQAERFLRRRLERMAAELGLSAEQRTALWNVHAEAGERIFAQRQAMREARAEMHEDLAAPAPDLARIHSVQRRISALQAELDSLVVEVMVRERAVLTPEQRERYRGFFPDGPGRGGLERGRGRDRHDRGNG